MKRSYVLVIALMSLTVLAGCAAPRPQDSEKNITSVTFSPDHSLLAFADATEIRVLEVASRAPVATLRELPQSIEGADPGLFRHGVGDSMVFLDNTRIATTGMGGMVSIWDVRSGRRLSLVDSLPGEEFASTIDYSRATNRLIIGTSSGQVLLTGLNGDDAGPLLPVASLEGYVWDLQFSQDGRYFASASMLPAPALVNESGEGISKNPAVGQINENSSPSTYDNVGKPVNGSTVTIWDAERLEKVGDLDGAREVSKMALVPGERALLTAGDEVQIWEFLTLEQAGQIRDPSMVMQGIGVGTMVAVSVLGLAAGAAVGAPFMAFDPLVSTQLAFLPAAMIFRPEACIRTAAISPDGNTVVSTTKGPSHSVMAVIDRPADKVVKKWTADLFVCDMEFSLDGKYLLTATSKGVFIYDTANWKKTNLRDKGGT
jgi:WD40 repeat protein